MNHPEEAAPDHHGTTSGPDSTDPGHGRAAPDPVPGPPDPDGPDPGGSLLSVLFRHGRGLLRGIGKRLPNSRHSGFCHGPQEAPLRVVVVASSRLETLQQGIVAPLREDISRKLCRLEVLTERDLRPLARKPGRMPFRTASPTHLVFCRYDGPRARLLLDHARKNGIPSIFCIDDDLLNVPPALGQDVYRRHNKPERLGAVRCLLDGADLVYCSNSRLMAALQRSGTRNHFRVGTPFWSGTIINPARGEPVRRIGYMGYRHARDFAIAAEAVARILEKYPHIEFEIFGTVPIADPLKPFRKRIRTLPAVREYRKFMEAFALRKWDIGLCPLESTPFNRAKHMVKWIEYTAAGAAVIASRGTVYDECCADGAGRLADDDAWFDHLDELVRNPAERFRQVCRAQDRLAREYNPQAQRRQLHAMLQEASRLHGGKTPEKAGGG